MAAKLSLLLPQVPLPAKKTGGGNSSRFHPHTARLDQLDQARISLTFRDVAFDALFTDMPISGTVWHLEDGDVT